MAQGTGTATIQFDATVVTVEKATILRMPTEASKQLRSRGQVAVRGTVNGQKFETVVEPDGVFGHWIRIDGKLQRAAGLTVGDTATVGIEPTKEWPEPAVPKDLQDALKVAPQKIQELWTDIT